MTTESRRPTPAELAILTVLWERGPSTVRQILNALEEPTGYTTVLKILQIMTTKKLVGRDTSSKSHVYHPRHPREEIQERLVDTLVDRAFGGSAASLVLRALSTRPASASELAEIRSLLDGLEPLDDAHPPNDAAAPGNDREGEPGAG